MRRHARPCRGRAVRRGGGRTRPDRSGGRRTRPAPRCARWPAGPLRCRPAMRGPRPPRPAPPLSRWPPPFRHLPRRAPHPSRPVAPVERSPAALRAARGPLAARAGTATRQTPGRVTQPGARDALRYPGAGGRPAGADHGSKRGMRHRRAGAPAVVDGIPLTTPATINCDTARALQTWVREGLVPAVGRTGGGVANLRVVASYACRTRNSQSGARLSEHARRQRHRHRRNRAGQWKRADGAATTGTPAARGASCARRTEPPAGPSARC
jgi:hypothetical protein